MRLICGQNLLCFLVSPHTRALDSHGGKENAENDFYSRFKEVGDLNHSKVRGLRGQKYHQRCFPGSRERQYHPEQSVNPDF